jgi:hypothetical protein
MKYLIFVGLFGFANGALWAQELQVPLVILSNADTCTKYESNIVNIAKWMEQTDLDKAKDKRQEAVDFVLQWMSSCKSVNVEVNDPVGVLYGKNDPLLGIFIASYCRYTIENRTTVTRFDATKAAVQSMMNVYKKGIAVSKTREMEKAIKYWDQGKLDEYIQEEMDIPKN